MCARVGDDESSSRRKVHSLPSLERASFSKDLFQIILTFVHPHQFPLCNDEPWTNYLFLYFNTHTAKELRQIIINI